jgi:hypothetical protein
MLESNLGLAGTSTFTCCEAQPSSNSVSSAGSFKQPLLAEGICIGVETVDGTKYYADKVVLAAGAWSSVLVDLEDQCVSKVSGCGFHLCNSDANIGCPGLGLCTYAAYARGSGRVQKRTRRL